MQLPTLKEYLLYLRDQAVVARVEVQGWTVQQVAGIYGIPRGRVRELLAAQRSTEAILEEAARRIQHRRDARHPTKKSYMPGPSWKKPRGSRKSSTPSNDT